MTEPGELPEVRDKDLGSLYVTHIQAVERLALALTGEPELAKDLSAEAFVRVAGRFRHLREGVLFDAYLRQAVVNLARSHFRHAKVERRWLARRDLREPAVSDSATEERAELWDALALLTYRQRAALVQRFYEDLSEEQTAELLHCSARAVNGLVSRGLATLRTHIRSE